MVRIRQLKALVETAFFMWLRWLRDGWGPGKAKFFL